MEYDIDSLVDQAYLDRQPIEDRTNAEEMKRIQKIEKEVEAFNRSQQKIIKLVKEFARMIK